MIRWKLGGCWLPDGSNLGLLRRWTDNQRAVTGPHTQGQRWIDFLSGGWAWNTGCLGGGQVTVVSDPAQGIKCMQITEMHRADQSINFELPGLIGSAWPPPASATAGWGGGIFYVYWGPAGKSINLKLPGLAIPPDLLQPPLFGLWVEAGTGVVQLAHPAAHALPVFKGRIKSSCPTFLLFLNDSLIPLFCMKEQIFDLVLLHFYFRPGNQWHCSFKTRRGQNLRFPASISGSEEARLWFDSAAVLISHSCLNPETTWMYFNACTIYSLYTFYGL